MHTTMSEAGLVFLELEVRKSPHHIHCQNVKDAMAKKISSQGLQQDFAN